MFNEIEELITNFEDQVGQFGTCGSMILRVDCYRKPPGNLTSVSLNKCQITNGYLGGAMALIEKFEERQIGTKHIHGGVICGYKSVLLEGQTILQLETYGSVARRVPNKVSQSIQLDKSAAAKLLKILQATFPEV